MKKTVPIGTEFFAKLRESNYYFVDKTPFLSEFFHSHADVTQQSLDIDGAEEHIHGVDIYNPWSVNNYFANACKPRRYWVRTSSNSILQTMLQQLDKKRTRDLMRLMEA